MNAGFLKTGLPCLILVGLTVCARGQDESSADPLTSNLTLTTRILAQRVSFETAADLQGLDNGVALSDRHFKDGRRSLLWRWSAPEPLVFRDLPGLEKAAGEYPGGQPERFEPAYIAPARHGGLKLWVYRESPNPAGSLVFQIGSNEKEAEANPAYRFEMRQNFSGWRALWVHLEEDARVAGYAGDERMTALRIAPTEDLADDRVYLDMLQFVTFVSKKRHSDWQFQNSKDTARVDHYRVLPAWQALGRFASADVDRDRLDRNRLDRAYDDLAAVERRYERLILATPGFDVAEVPEGEVFEQYLDGRIARANEEWEALAIRRTQYGVTGIPLFSSRDEHPAEVARTYQHVGEHILGPLAIGYRRSPSPEKKQRLVDLLEHMADQGWAAGSATGTTDHIIRLNPYANAVFLLREELRRMGQLQDHQQAIAWFTRFGGLADIDTGQGENSDHIRGGAGPKLISVLLMDDSPEKVARLRALRGYLTHTSNFAPGYTDTIKPDYSIYHHLAAYQNVYGIQGVATMAILDWLLRGTQFALPEENTRRLRDTLMAQFDMAADFELHPALSGRFPYRNSGIDRYLMPSFAFAAMRDDELVDRRLGAAFAWAYERADLRLNHGSLVPRLNYYGTFGTLEFMESAYRQAEGLHWAPPAGHFTFPYGAFAIQKRPGWAAAVRGWSRYVWDWESGHKVENPYGRYLAFGSLLLLTQGEPLSLEASGIDLDGGFHWAYAPGATTKALPMSEVLYEVKPTPLYFEGKHRNYSGDTFVGGVSHGGRDGFYAMNLEDTVPSDDEPLFDDSFRAKKSLLFVDNQIVALGSGIANDDENFSTITTLFQSVSAHGPARVNGMAVGDRTPFVEAYDGGLFADPQSNYYIVPPGQSVVIEQSEQHSLVPAPAPEDSAAGDSPRHRPVSAAHVKAWLEHGAAPNGEEYEYQILVQGDIETARRLAKARNYRVLRKDNRAHIVEHREKGLTAYALFVPQDDVPGVVDAVDTPLLLVAGMNGGELRLSVADPDLRLAKWPRNMSNMPVSLRNRPAESHVAEIRISGSWAMPTPHPDIVSVQAEDTHTVIRITLDHGMTREISLQK